LMCVGAKPREAHRLRVKWFLDAVTAALVSFLSLAAGADEIRVAVATNFAAPVQIIVTRFAENTGHRVVPVLGSTGKHFAQIKNGAPFAAFLAADARRPALLEEEGIAVARSRFTYAVGRIVLWSPREAYVDAQGRVLTEGDFHHLAIANPALAPYGRAAREVLQARGLWEALATRIVRGEDIGQTFHFVESDNAELGFVAYSQVKRPGHAPRGSWWEVPQALYRPIEQHGLLRDRAVEGLRHLPPRTTGRMPWPLHLGIRDEA